MPPKISRIATTLALALAAAALPAGPVRAQEPYRPQTPGALLAAETLRQQMPDHSFNRLVEISGKEGNPIPRAWTVIAHDPRSPSGLTQYVVRGRKIELRGETDTFYPRVPPEGFFALSRVTVDSEQAFRIADKEAGLARVGFDSLDFRLRAREFTEDAVWTVRLRNADDEIVGNVDISASSAKILRAVWYYRDAATGTMRILDTAAPGAPRPSTDQPPAAPPAPLAPAPFPSGGPPDAAAPPPGTPIPGTVPPETLPPVPADPSLQPAPEPLPVPPPGIRPEPVPVPVPVPVPEPRLSPGLSPRPVPVPAPFPAPVPVRPGTGPAVPR